MFQKWAIAWMLLLTAVPAGCLPLFTAAAVKDEVFSDERTRRGRAPTASTTAWIFIAIGASVALVLNWLYVRMLRRVRRLAVGEAWKDLTRPAWEILLWVAYAMGMVCGAMMLLSI